jgi:hypothetical protein
MKMMLMYSLVGHVSGTGVGMVNKGGPAGEIVKQIREETKETVRGMAELI